MTSEFHYLLNLLGCLIRAMQATPPEEELSWDMLFQLAKEQTVYSMILYVLKLQPDLYIDYVRHNLDGELRSLCIRESIRREAAKPIIDALSQHGIQPVVLKGFGLSILYSIPEIRQSADLDIYVGISYEKKAQTILQNCGVSVKQRNSEAHEAVCHHPVLGTLELHAWLFGREMRERWFPENPSGISQPFRVLQLPDGYVINTLGDDDNFTFITMHYIKHFVHYGANLRNMLDVALFFRENNKHINTRQYWERLRQLRFDGLINASLSACIYFCGMNMNDFPGMTLVDQDIAEQVISDIEAGGWMGMKEHTERQEISKIYERILYDQTTTNGNIRYLWYKRRIFLSLWKSLFCPRKHLIQRFPYANRSVFLIPVAYVHRSFRGLRKLYRGKMRPIIVDSDIKVSGISERRIELFERLGILQ